MLTEEPRELVDVLVANRARDRGDGLAAIGEQHARAMKSQLDDVLDGREPKVALEFTTEVRNRARDPSRQTGEGHAIGEVVLEMALERQKCGGNARRRE